MKERATPRRRTAPSPRLGWTAIRTLAFRATGVVVVGFFAIYAIFGANGLIAWGDHKRDLAAKRAELEAVDRERVRLANRVRLVDPQKADPDMVDEIVRNQLGVAAPDEVIVPLPQQ